MRLSVPSQPGTGPHPDTVLLVDGIDGSGKTLFAGRLADTMREAGTDVVLAHVDDYRCPVSWDDPAGEAAVYWDRYFDLAALERDLTRLLRPGRVVVLEGIFTLRLPAFAASPLVYLEVEYGVAAQRILRRDTAIGRTPEDVRHRIEARYFPAQRRYRADYAPAERATTLIDSTDPACLRLLRSDWTRLPPPAAAALRQQFRAFAGGSRPE
jgi:uridine kinase